MEANDAAGQLRRAKLIDDSAEPLPDEYYSVIDRLTDVEVDALISFKQKLDDAEIPTTPLTASVAGAISRGPMGMVVF